ncbi:MAG: preprotein translocase subunit SecY [Myxococcota bacterium]|nr:preprotein translocase subunit SecY [Myxococcota bacterium]MDW8363229.1 preprotein translocase subunit SecY [Myxococcales bacterium]
MSWIANIARIPELRRRLLFTLGMLAVYRIGIFVTTPGVDRNVMRQIVQSQSGSFLGLINLFSGGAFEQLSIFALGIMPYVTASIVFSLLTAVVRPLEELRKEGEAGMRRINQYTRYATVVLAAVQGFGVALFLEGQNDASRFGDVVAEPGWAFRLMTVLSLTTGTAFIMWLGEQITERGVGNGISLIIFAGIIADLPGGLFQLGSLVQLGQVQPIGLLVLAFVGLGAIAVIVFFERAQRRLPIHYSKRMVGRRLYGGTSSHLPLRVNMAGVIPPIFASSLLMFPTTLANLGVPGMDWLQNQMQPDGWVYLTVFVALTIFFTYFYTSVQFQPVDVAENLKKQSAFIPSIRPGKATAEYIDRVVTRITFGGAVYIAAVCTLPSLLQTSYHVPFYYGGTSLMIVVGVALDTVQQIESHLITRHYEGLAGPSGPRIRGRRG